MADKLVSKKDIIKGWAKYYLCAEVSSGFERLTAPAFSFGMDPVLNKLYHDNPEEYKEALKRHLMFYNCEATWGSMLFGMSCALEEERAVRLKEGASKEELDASSELISNLKIGLMGPLAGIGDSVNHGMLRPLLISLFIPLASAGCMDCRCSTSADLGRLHFPVCVFPDEQRVLSGTEIRSKHSAVQCFDETD